MLRALPHILSLVFGPPLMIAPAKLDKLLLGLHAAMLHRGSLLAPDLQMREGDGSSNRLVKFTDVRIIRRMLRDVQHRNYSPITTILHWHYVRAGELFSR